MGWTIIEWSREQGRGRIESDAGRLDFDAHVALVDDFRVGEPVEISLVDGKVHRIAPVVARSLVDAIAHGLPGVWDEELGRLNKHLGPTTDVVLVGYSEQRLDLELWNHAWPPPHRRALAKVCFGDVKYLQLETHSERVARVTGRRWSALHAARPAWLDQISIQAADLDSSDVLVLLEDDAFGIPPGMIIAGSISVEV